MKPILFNLIFIGALFSSALAQNPWDDPKADSVEVGLELFDNGNYVKAINYFDAALEYDAKYTEAWFYKAKANFELKDYKKTIKLADKVIKYQDHFMLNAYLLKASAFSKMNQFDDVVATFEKAIEKYPNSTLLYRKLGIRYLKREETDKARKFLVDAVILNHKDAHAQRALSHVLFKNNEDLLGVLVLYRALMLNPKDEEVVKMFELLQQKIQGILKQGWTEGPVTVERNKLGDLKDLNVETVAGLAKGARLLFGNLETSDLSKDNFWWHYYAIFYQTLNVNSLAIPFHYYIASEVHKDECGKYMLSESSQMKAQALQEMMDNHQWPKLLR